MNIEIASRLHPFSHTPGVTCLIPRTQWQVQVFPVLLRLQKTPGEVIEHPLDLRGPIRDFTVEQDLEKGIIRVFGHTPVGLVRYQIHAEAKGIFLTFEKNPSAHKKQVLLVQEPTLKTTSPTERLSLGMHRSQEWEMVKRTRDLSEIFPAWIQLAQWIPESQIASVKANGHLLNLCTDAIQNVEKNSIVSHFLNLFDAAFYGILTPRLFDDQFQGIAPADEKSTLKHSPLFLLLDGAALIRSLFFQEHKDSLSLLPCLPPQFHAGRYVNLKTPDGITLSMEWSKKLLRRLIVHSSTHRQIMFNMQKPITSFRLRRTSRERGKTIQVGEALELQANKTIYLDNFQK
jgi:hypothetical protein